MVASSGHARLAVHPAPAKPQRNDAWRACKSLRQRAPLRRFATGSTAWCFALSRERSTPSSPRDQVRTPTNVRRSKARLKQSGIWALALAFAVASRAHDARRFPRGPSVAVRQGRKSRAAGEARDGLAFSRGHDARSKSPAPPHALFAHGWAKSAAAGCRFSLATFSLGKQRESSSRARRAHETALMPCRQASAPTCPKARRRHNRLPDTAVYIDSPLPAPAKNLSTPRAAPAPRRAPRSVRS